MRTVFVLASILVLAGGAGAVASPSLVIHGDSRIGDFYVRRGGTLGGAVDAFGQPDTREFNDLVNVCTATWNAIGLRLVLVNFGGGDPCGNTSGLFVKATMRPPGVWQTGRGLRIGSSVPLLQALYRHASYHRSAANWWLITRFKAVAGGGRSAFPGLLAHVRNGQVAWFAVQATASGA